ncbi:MAG: ABC transporter permease [Acidobacteria bacterium]|nr:ABC transporter permease [Acidobacteriota bacterium]
MGPILISRIALTALGRNKARTALSILGIVIGVAAVICTVAIGEGAAARVKEATSAIGVNLIWVEAGSVNVQGARTGSAGTRSLVNEDMVAIRALCPLVTYVSPQVDTGLQVIRGSLNWRTTVRGVTPEYMGIRNWKVVQGAMFTDLDVTTMANVCVLGRTVMERLFLPEEDPIGQIIRVKDKPCKVIGVLAPKGATVTGGDNDDTFLMPYSTVQRRIKGQFWLDDILCSAASGAVVRDAENQIISIVRIRHRIAEGQPDDFNLRHPTEIAELIAEQTRTMEMLLTGIAAVSLLVGSVGIMNIMLVSVTERTREIGIRMATGARGRDIRWQFLVEALVLTVGGGGLGTLAGYLGSQMLASYLGWPMHLSMQAVAISIGVSTAIGIFFGFYPAHQAARLDPISALQSE